MMKFKIDTSQLSKRLKEIATDQIPFAVSHAMNQALIQAKEEVVQQMDVQMEGGATRWTKQGMAFLFTRKDDLTGKLYFKRDRGYMLEIMEGGKKQARNKKLPEPVMKNQPPLNPRGNWPRNFQQNLASKYRAGRGKRSGKKSRAASAQYFMGKVGAEQTFGIWHRTPTGLKIVTSYRRASRKQRQTFPAREIALRTFVENYRKQLPKSINMAMNTSR